MAQTQLEAACETLINIFHQYSVRVDDFDTLSKGELKQLVEKQLPNYLKNPKDPKAIGELLKKLDQNKDQQVSFGEFMILMTDVLVISHENIHKEGGEGHGHSH